MEKKHSLAEKSPILLSYCHHTPSNGYDVDFVVIFNGQDGKIKNAYIYTLYFFLFFFQFFPKKKFFLKVIAYRHFLSYHPIYH